jgi:hypothetical protein
MRAEETIKLGGQIWTRGADPFRSHLSFTFFDQAAHCIEIGKEEILRNADIAICFHDGTQRIFKSREIFNRHSFDHSLKVPRKRLARRPHRNNHRCNGIDDIDRSMARQQSGLKPAYLLLEVINHCIDLVPMEFIVRSRGGDENGKLWSQLVPDSASRNQKIISTPLLTGKGFNVDEENSSKKLLCRNHLAIVRNEIDDPVTAKVADSPPLMANRRQKWCVWPTGYPPCGDTPARAVPSGVRIVNHAEYWLKIDTVYDWLWSLTGKGRDDRSFLIIGFRDNRCRSVRNRRRLLLLVRCARKDCSKKFEHQYSLPRDAQEKSLNVEDRSATSESIAFELLTLRRRAEGQAS